MLPNLNIVSGIPSANNFDPLTPERYSIYIKWMEALPENLRISLMERSNIGWVENRVTNTSEGIEFQKLDALPKVQWRNCAEWVLESDDILQGLENNLGREVGDYRVILERNQQLEIQEECIQSEHDLSYIETSTKVQIQVRTTNAGWIFLANVWYPGWNVYVDGAKEINHRADYIFQAVHVEKGNHLVEWRYEPKSLTVGAFLSGLSLLFMIVWSCWPVIRNRFRRSLDQ